jgi:hypothetical protein
MPLNHPAAQTQPGSVAVNRLVQRHRQFDSRRYRAHASHGRRHLDFLADQAAVTTEDLAARGAWRRNPSSVAAQSPRSASRDFRAGASAS